MTFSAKKVKLHTVGDAVGMQYTVRSRYAVGTQYAVGVSAKRSTHTVDLANMGGADCFLWCKKVKQTQWDMQYAVGTPYAVGTFSAKRSNPHSGVCSRYAVHSTQ